MTSEFVRPGLRRRDESPRAGAGLVITLAALIAVAAVAETSVHGLTQAGTAAAFAALIAVGEVVRVRLPGEREIAPVGAAAALAYALVLDVNGTVSMHDAWQVA